MSEDRHQPGQEHQAEPAQSELDHQQHAEGTIRRLRPRDDGESHPDQQAAHQTVEEAQPDQQVRHLDKGRDQIDDDQTAQHRNGGRSPGQSTDDEDRDQRAHRRPVDIGRDNQPGLLRRQPGTADQTIDQGGHDVHIEQAGGGEEGQQDAGQQAVLGNVRQAAARRRGGQNIVGHRHSPLIFAASTAAGDQSKIPLSPK